MRRLDFLRPISRDRAPFGQLAKFRARQAICPHRLGEQVLVGLLFLPRIEQFEHAIGRMEIFVAEDRDDPVAVDERLHEAPDAVSVDETVTITDDLDATRPGRSA